jgi:aminoglycoside phosphotransferase (APT) family kinase protein
MKTRMFALVLLCIHSCLLTMQIEQVTQQQCVSYIHQHLEQWAPGRSVTRIEELKGGLGGAQLYTVNFNQGDPYVVRLLTGPFAREKSWQDIEIESMKTAAHVGVGPQIFAAHAQDSDTKIGYVVMQKINISPAIPWDSKHTYHTLGAFLKNMHNQPSVVSIDQEAMYSRTSGRIGRIKNAWEKEQIDGLSNELGKVATFFERSKNALSPQQRTHLVHGDLLLGNLLYGDDRFWAIDWEHSHSFADPLFDTALVHDCLVPKEYRQDFMTGYCGHSKLAPSEQEQFNLMQAIANLFIGVAYVTPIPALFVTQFHKHTQEKTNINHALHTLMRAGLKRETKEDCVTFGTLLFMQGYRWLKPKRFPILEHVLNYNLQRKNKNEDF